MDKSEVKNKIKIRDTLFLLSRKKLHKIEIIKTTINIKKPLIFQIIERQRGITIEDDLLYSKQIYINKSHGIL